ncbi:hypothetical protein [Haloglomus salinum]|uniref:hypothetical protein n=1 Tax=Haloglomus salinum TaxID=2962673 RepID=UPI0020C9C9B7|nr:hypothetical protein [Haloglomus salinum]
MTDDTHPDDDVPNTPDDDIDLRPHEDPRTPDYGLRGDLVDTGREMADAYARDHHAWELAVGEVVHDDAGRPVAIGADLRSAELTPENGNAHTDAASIRRLHGIPHYDPTVWRSDGAGWGPVADLYEHYWTNPPADQTEGGIFGLVLGPPGKGKSTLLRTCAQRFLEANGHRMGEAVVWRGAPSRSEWLPLAPWVRLILPARAEIDATLRPERPVDPVGRDPELGNFAREVVHYQGPVDALRKCRAGGINVVYPDPTFSHCQRLFESIPSRTVEPPAQRDDLFAPGDPTPHWWVALLLAAVDGRDRSTPLALIWDEIKDIAPDDAKKDTFGSYQKVHQLGGDLTADLRKRNVTLVGAGHGEVAVSARWRRKIHYRLHTAGRAVPTTDGAAPLGFGSTPFESNVNKGKDPGEGTLFSPENFEEVDWPNAADLMPSYSLQINTRDPIPRESDGDEQPVATDGGASI